MLARVKFFRQYSSFFPGESAWLPPNVVDELVTDRKAKRYLEGDTLEEWPEADAKPTVVASGDVEEEQKLDLNKFDATKDPFVLDGLDEPTSKALHAANLHTPGDVEAYINSGKVLTELEKITPTRAKKITELYGVK